MQIYQIRWSENKPEITQIPQKPSLEEGSKPSLFHLEQPLFILRNPVPRTLNNCKCVIIIKSLDDGSFTRMISSGDLSRKILKKPGQS